MPARITARVNDDRQTAQVTVRSEGGVEHLLEMTADEIEDATLALINARDRLDPPFPERVGVGHKFRMMRWYRWSVFDRRIKGKRVLFVLFPGVGWYGLTLDDDTAHELADRLASPIPDAVEPEANG
jgi:hypothetical protein